MCVALMLFTASPQPVFFISSCLPSASHHSWLRDLRQYCLQKRTCKAHQNTVWTCSVDLQVLPMRTPTTASAASGRKDAALSVGPRAAGMGLPSAHAVHRAHEADPAVYAHGEPLGDAALAIGASATRAGCCMSNLHGGMTRCFCCLLAAHLQCTASQQQGGQGDTGDAACGQVAKAASVLAFHP